MAKAKFRSWQMLFAALAICALLGNYSAITGAFREVRSRYASNGNVRDEYLTGPREMVAENLWPSDTLCFVSSGDVREEHAEKAVIQAVTWQIMPQSLAVIAPEDIADICDGGGKHTAIMSPSFNQEISAFLSAPDSPYRKMAERGGRALWQKKGAPLAMNGKPSMPSPSREAFSLIPLAVMTIASGIAYGTTGILVSALILSILCMVQLAIGIPLASSGLLYACIAVWISSRANSRAAIKIQPLAIALAIFAAFAFLTLAHTFTTPYGLAISGGRAKLWHLLASCHGDGLFSWPFFKNADWKPLEPVYPPGYTAIIASCYAFVNAYGEWLTQLIGCAFFAVLAYEVACGGDGAGKKFWLVSLLLTPAALVVGGQFYPEPLMALCVLVGWRRIRDGESGGLSWLLVGSAGWFKNEGLIFALAAWAAWRIIGGRNAAQIKFIAAGIALPLIWHAASRVAGGTLNDYLSIWQIYPGRCLNAACEIAKQIFAKPWLHAFAYPAAIALAIFRKCKSGKAGDSLVAALIFTGLSIAAFICVYGCSTAESEWHLATSLPRLLWTPALVLAYEVARVSNSD